MEEAQIGQGFKLSRARIRRFKANCFPEPMSGCVLWTGRTFERFGLEYGRLGQELAHRFAYRLFKGEIPRGFEPDHLCRTTLCVNEHHLEAVTHQENVLRGNSPFARKARQTHCKRGHPLSGDNLRADIKNGRGCNTCQNTHGRGYYVRGPRGKYKPRKESIDA